MHLSSFDYEQLMVFNDRVAEIKQQEGFDFLEQFPINQLPDGIEDAQAELLKQIRNEENCFHEDLFIRLLKIISGSEEGGWDNKIRLPQLADSDFKFGKIEPSVSQN